MQRRSRWKSRIPTILSYVSVAVALMLLSLPVFSIFTSANRVIMAVIILGLAAGSIAGRVGRMTWAILFARHYGWVPSLFGLALFPYFLWYVESNPSQLDNEFFIVIAQVLPVFILATVLDVRRSRSLHSHQLLVPLSIVMMGEGLALTSAAFGLSDESLDHNAFAFVSSAFVVAVLALLMAVLADIDDRPAADQELDNSQPAERPSAQSPSGSKYPEDEKDGAPRPPLPWGPPRPEYEVPAPQSDGEE